ncbi:ribonuclease Z [Nanoarchaeota archaeon]
MELTILGTAAMVPTKDRNVSATYLDYKGEGILFDCGEGSQRQMNLAGINRNKVNKILLTHWHGDHIGGIIGLLQTISNKESEKNIEIFGPKETKERFNNLMKASVFDNHLKIKVHELPDTNTPKKCFENNDYIIEYISLEHSCPTIGFSFIEKDKIKINKAYLKKHKIRDGPHLKKLQEGKSITYKGEKIDVKEAATVVKGRKITYALDSIQTLNIVQLAQNADVLICESTYLNKQEEKAEQYQHLTAKQAAYIATQANAKKLVLTHFSQRYKNNEELEEEVKSGFDNSACAYDLMKMRI